MRELAIKRKIKVKTAGFRPGSRHPFDWPLKRMQKPAEHLLTLRLTDTESVSDVRYGFGSPPFRSTNRATHQLWRKMLMTILSRALSLVWHRSNGRDGARPAVVCSFAAKPSLSAAPNAEGEPGRRNEMLCLFSVTPVARNVATQRRTTLSAQLTAGV